MGAESGTREISSEKVWPQTSLRLPRGRQKSYIPHLLLGDGPETTEWKRKWSDSGFMRL